MRKFIFIALAVLLVLSFATLTFAEDQQIKLGGRILVRGWNFNGVDWDTALPSEDANAISLYTTNIYLTVDAKVSDNVQGFLELESCNNETTGSSGLYTWGAYDQKPDADLQFRQAWIQYTGSGLLGVPSGIKVGHQLLTLGEKQFLNLERFGTDAILVFTEPTKELFLGALTLKLAEDLGAIATPGRQPYTDNTNDLDAYVLLGTYKLDKDNTIGLNYTYANMSDADLAFQNIGAHANGLLWGALNYAAEADFQFGDIGDPGADFGGWGAMVKLGYKLNPVNLRASFAYGSGDDDAFDDNIDEMQVVMATDLQSPLARFVHYTQIYERTIATAAFEPVLNGGPRSTGIANTTYFNLGLDYMPMKDLSLSLDGFYLMVTETGAWEDILQQSVDDNIGWEVDFKGSYQITKNLSYFAEAGWFDPGDFYKDILPNADESVIQLVHGLNLTF